MAFFGLGLLLWFLAAIAGGAETYAAFTGWVWADWSALEWSGAAIVASIVKILLKIIVVGVSWAFFNHLCSGLRHFVMDAGAGYELDTNKTFAVLSIVGGLVLTAAFWAAIIWL